jgi:hypothetical protein
MRFHFPRPALALAGLAAAVTALDAVKPLTIDDGGFCIFARQIAAHPLDPFGFEFMGANPAMETLAPLLLPYWVAGAMRLLGDQPWLWKLSLLPFVLLLAWALYALLRRFARGLELPLTAMLMLSPTFLPSWNLMADMPALALSTAALAVYLAAADRPSAALAALAGVLAGLGMLAKYTGFVAPAVFLLHAALYGGWRRGLLAAALAGLVFTGWEAYIASVYGDSHFLFHLRQRGVPVILKLRLVLPLLTCLGGLAPCLGLLGLTALGASRRAVGAAAAFAGLGYALAALLPIDWQTLTRSPETGAPRALLSAVCFTLTGLMTAAVTLAVWQRLRRGAGEAAECAGPAGEPDEAGGWRADWFLLLWLGLEVAGCLAMTPYPATRRILGVEVVMTVLAGRLAARTCRSPDRRGLVRGAVVGSALLGLAFFGVDWWEARARQAAAEGAARWAQRQEGGANCWFVAGCGFDFYCERGGLRRLTRHSGPGPGDWLVIESTQAEAVHYPLPDFPPARQLVVTDWLPLRTQRCYYASGTPVEHCDGPRFVVGIYRLPGGGPAGAGRAVAARPAGD